MKKNFIQNRWKVMKICTVQLLMAIFFCSFTIAHPGYAQVLERRVTLHIDDLNFFETLQEIETRAQIRFVYSASQFLAEEKVTLHANDIPLKSIFGQLFSARDIVFKVHETEGTVTLRKDQPGTGRKQSLKNDELLQISGLVTDVFTGQPMAGVNILIKGTTQGTTSDNDGNYVLQAGEKDILVFSFIGYATLETEVNNQTVINVALQEDIQSLSEVTINAGYYTTRKETQTGNIARVDARDIEKQSVSNPIATLQGRITGVEVTQTSGIPGGNFRVRVRGQNSIASGNDPLYIIDGVPFISSSLSMRETSSGIYRDGGANPLNGINPQDIESIEVLKDADATAIYGSRGSNGVILITTKKGKKGKTNVDITYREGAGNVSDKMNLLQTPEYVVMRNEAFANDGLSPTEANAPDLLVWDQSRNTDWQQALLGGTASFRDAQLTVSGGETYTQFSAGGAYHRETTVFPGENSDERLSTHLSVSNTSPSGKLQTFVTLNYSVNNTTLPQVDLTYTALTLSPNAPPLYNDQGELNWGQDQWNYQSGNMNPLTYTRSLFESRTSTLIGNASVSFAILDDLHLRSNMGFSKAGMTSVATSPLSAMDPAAVTLLKNSSSFADRSFQNWIIEPQLTWKKTFGKSTLDALAGTSFLEQIDDGNALQAIGFSSESLMKNINAADQILKGRSLYTQYRYHAIFGRVNYSFDDKYLVNITGRRDGSSRFGPGKQFSNFGAIGAAWIFSKESFLDESTFLSFGKLRASFGTTGNDQIGDYQYLDTYSPNGSGNYLGTSGLNPQRLFNSDFAWETVRKMELAMELGFFENRITTQVSYYRNRSSNQLVGMPLPTTTGFYSIQSNFPAIVQNTGLEVELNAMLVKKSTFNWSAAFNLSIPRNELVEYPGLETSEYANRYAVGEPLDILKMYHYAGVDPENGMYQFSDVNNDGQYTFEDRTFIGFRGRKFYGGIANAITYRDFELDFLIEFVKQSAMNEFAHTNTAPGSLPFNSPVTVTDRWTTPGDLSDIQKFSTLSDYQIAFSRYQISDRAITDASFLRLKTVSLYWSIPSAWAARSPIANLRLFVQGQNIFTVTNYKGLNPENQLAMLPPLRVLTAGVNVKF
jgi:TonB-dependent starch-binding outer membrane protein SusC